MKSRFTRIAAASRSIRMLVVFWAASMFLAWACLVGGWLTARHRLSRIDQRVALDAEALEAAHNLESDVLTERYDDLLWDTTGQSKYKQESENHLLAAERIAANLDPYITTDAEGELSAQIQREMKTLREQSQSATSTPSQGEPSLANLLSAVHRFDGQNQVDLRTSLWAADALDMEITDWALALLVITAVLLLAGSLTIIDRVVRPALALAASARNFGRGDFSVRGAILHEDEMGGLARTFNNMAEDIANREEDRLHFVAMVVHDLKNPAFAIEMGAHLLRESWADGQPAKTDDVVTLLDAMSDEAKRLRTIIRDLTDDIQVASGRFSLNKVKVDLCVLVRRLVQSQGQAFVDHRITVEGDEACTVLGDADRLERVVQNLVSNAVKYSPRDTQVTVRIEKQESFVLVAVTDQGQGISAEDQRVLFQPFGRGRSAKRLVEGAGMGLFVVKQIIGAHGGQITVQSEPGQGTTFQFKLPLA